MIRYLFTTVLSILALSSFFNAKADDRFFAVDDQGAVVISAACTAVPARAFEDFGNITSIRFESPSRCEYIGDYAFADCGLLEEVILPPCLKSLGEATFKDCVSLKRIVIPIGVKAIPSHCFYGCSALEDVELHSEITDIAKLAFIYCSSLETLDLPAGLTHIGNNAFTRCESLTEVVVPSEVTELESYAFSDCVSLRTLWLPANSSILGELICSGCDSLENLIELSPSAPEFDCKSFIFEPDDYSAYERCRLTVPAKALKDYLTAHGWNLFKHISSYDKD